MNESHITQQELNVETAKSLLQWNSKNLISHAALRKSDLVNFFASKFTVIANGSKNEANYDNYYEFLNLFRANIKAINYTLQTFIVDESHVVIPLTAIIQRDNHSRETFDAILVLQFNDVGKVILWREVYVKIT